MTMTAEVRPYSFNKGYQQLQLKDVAKARAELMEALGVTTMENFRHRLSGKVVPKADQKVKVEEVFKKYNIKNIWGE